MRISEIIKVCFVSLIVSLIGGSSIGYAQITKNSREDFSAIDAYVNSQMSKYRIPGLALAIIHGDQIVYMRGYGIANQAGDPVTQQTSFIIGSTGKSITATAMMLLVDEGKVDLDAPVQKYLPWFRLSDEAASKQVTVRMLLNHASGIPGDAGAASKAYSDESLDALEEQVRSFSTVKLSHTPGTSYEYANANYQIAGMVIQAVSGQSFQDFIRERIYTPLDMRNSFTSKDEARQHGMATGYRYWFGYPLPADNLPYSYKQFPAGWYICSVEDLAHYLILHMNNGRYGDKTLVSADGMAELHRPVLNDYAMGWVVVNGIISHNGGVPNYGSGLYFDSNTDYGVVALFNADQGEFYSPVHVIAPSVLEMLDGRQPFLPTPDTWHNIMIPALAITLILQVVWFLLSAWAIRRWGNNRRNQPKYLVTKLIWLIVPLIFELGLAYYIISSFRAQGGTVLTAIITQPNIVSMALISFALAIGWGLTRTILSMRLLVSTRV